MTEILVQPYRNAAQEMVDQFYAQLATYPNLEWIAPNLDIADAAARTEPLTACAHLTRFMLRRQFTRVLRC